MYSDAAKTVGAAFEVAELTTLIEQALGQAEPAELDGLSSGGSLVHASMCRASEAQSG